MMFSWAGRRVLVTGATGIVGSWLCEELLTRGATVVAFVRDDDPASRFYSDGVVAGCSVVRGDLVDLSACTRAVNEAEVEVVFHLGAQTIVGAALRDPLGTFESNVRGTYNLLEAVRRVPGLVKALVVASSDKAYGEAPQLPYTEEMPLRGRHPYDVSKSCTDLISATYAHTYGSPIAIARCGNIYGGGDLNWSRIVPGTIRSLMRGERPVLRSDGLSRRDYVYVRDACSAYLVLAAAVAEGTVDPGEAFNFGPERPLDVFDVVRQIAEIMVVEDGVASATAEPIVRDEAVFEIRDQWLDCSKARRDLDWAPRWTADVALRETVAWYRNHRTGIGEPGAEQPRNPSAIEAATRRSS